MPSMSVAEYARHCQCTPAAVYAAIKAGKITKNAWGKINSEEADANWKRRNFYANSQDAPHMPKGEFASPFGGSKPPIVNRPPSSLLSVLPEDKKPELVNGQVPLDDGIEDEIEDPMKQYLLAKIRSEQSKSALQEIKAAQLAGKLIPIEEFQERMQKMIMACRTKMLALPSKLKSRLPTLTSEQHKIIDNMIRENLQELSQDEI